ncbi:polysaccharide deacetylase family protein [Aureimonas psammosilenae]|uniref:polysaccharide deacetylase family protein n=1 Tax=Aureimonas psammosilenae TaxID=2495496 RepID=UPI00186A566B|nr:polysaccharide deacetylase family protein [Aureimonas psammosilenae]
MTGTKIGNDAAPTSVTLSATSFPAALSPGEEIARIVLADPRAAIVNFSPNDGRIVLSAEGPTLRRGHAPLDAGEIDLVIDTWHAEATPPLRRSLLRLAAAADGALSLQGRTVLPEAPPGTPIGRFENLIPGAAIETRGERADLVTLGAGASLVKGRGTVRPGYFNVTVDGGDGMGEATFTLKAPRTSVMVEDFEDLSSGWSRWTPEPATHEADTDWFVTGRRSLRLSQAPGITATVRGRRALPTEAPIREDDIVSVAVNVPDPRATKSFALILEGAGNKATQLTFDNLARGPSVYAKPIAEGTAGAGFAGPVTAITLAVYGGPNGGARISFDSIRFNAKGRATVIPMADDGYASQVTANDMLAAKNKGWRLTLALQADSVGKPNASAPRITMKQLVTLKAAGVPIINHSTTHPDWGTVTRDTAERELQGCIDFIRDNGLSTTVTGNGRPCKGSEYHCCYPGGGSSPASDAAMRAKGMLTGFGVQSTAIPTKDGVLGAFSLGRFSMARRGFPQIKAAIDAAVHQGATLPVFCHDLDGSGIGTTAAIYAQMVDYLDELDEAGLVEVRTLLDWYEALPQAPLPLRGVTLALDRHSATIADMRRHADIGFNAFRVSIGDGRIASPGGANALGRVVLAAREVGCTMILAMDDPAGDGDESPVGENSIRQHWRKIAEAFVGNDNVRYCLPRGGRADLARAGVRDADARAVIHDKGRTGGTARNWVSSGDADAYVAGLAHRTRPFVVELAQPLNDTAGEWSAGMETATAHARRNGYSLFLGGSATSADPARIEEARRLLRFCHDNRDIWQGFAWRGALFPVEGRSENGGAKNDAQHANREAPHLPQLNMLTEFLPIGD